jgi:hypothetical protein
VRELIFRKLPYVNAKRLKNKCKIIQKFPEKGYKEEELFLSAASQISMGLCSSSSASDANPALFENLVKMVPIDKATVADPSPIQSSKKAAAGRWFPAMRERTAAQAPERPRIEGNFMKANSLFCH